MPAVCKALILLVFYYHPYQSLAKIGVSAFSECRELTSVEIPGSVTEIGDHAFSSCTGLTSVAISENVTAIGISTFYGCSSLTSVEIPGSLTRIGDFAFSSCSSLADIYYCGSQEQWDKIEISDYENDVLQSA
ncbi:MAG: leucine-rich repeat domain-containing protein, partial [Lachnospiraceae bacterium]|nr:leucine-rich repeat domain-containing protein [Lachnospiraceae bacterium]